MLIDDSGSEETDRTPSDVSPDGGRERFVFNLRMSGGCFSCIIAQILEHWVVNCSAPNRDAR